MIFCYQGMDSMINRAMLNNHVSFYKNALSRSFNISFKISAFFILVLIGYRFFYSIEENYFFLFLLVLIQIPISSLEKIECGLLGLNRFKELIYYKLFSSLVSFMPLLGSVLGLEVRWIIIVIVLTKLFVVGTSVFTINKILVGIKGNPNYEESFYIEEAKRLTLLSSFSTLLTYVWPLILFKIEPSSLAVYFNGNKIPEKIKDYSKLFVSVPSQHWLKKGKSYFAEKIKRKGPLIFGVSLTFSGFLIMTASFYIPLIFGHDYKDSIYITQIILLGVPARVLSAILQSREIFHEKNSDFFRKSNYLQALLNLFLAIPMVYFYKEVGLAFHSLIMSYLSYVISLLRFRYFARESGE